MSELERLRDRVAELEELLGAADEPQFEAFGLTRVQRQLLHLLVKRHTVSRDMAYAALYGGRPERDQPEIKIIDVHMVRIRAKLKPHDISIKTDWGRGWIMFPAEKQKLRSVLDGVPA